MLTPAEAVEETRLYLGICFAGVPFITAYNVISSIFRGAGDSRRPMYFVAVACVGNDPHSSRDHQTPAVGNHRDHDKRHLNQPVLTGNGRASRIWERTSQSVPGLRWATVC